MRHREFLRPYSLKEEKRGRSPVCLNVSDLAVLIPPDCEPACKFGSDSFLMKSGCRLALNPKSNQADVANLSSFDVCAARISGRKRCRGWRSDDHHRSPHGHIQSLFWPRGGRLASPQPLFETGCGSPARRTTSPPDRRRTAFPMRRAILFARDFHRAFRQGGPGALGAANNAPGQHRPSPRTCPRRASGHEFRPPADGPVSNDTLLRAHESPHFGLTHIGQFS